ncbi:MAG: hypothetical protein QXO40_02625 [Candidatus Aenigmatarchaeota archaeon]
MKGKKLSIIVAVLLIFLVFSVVLITNAEERERIRKIIEINEIKEIAKEIRKECKIDADCIDIFCPQAIGIDTPRCIENRCICGPNPALNLTKINETTIGLCIKLRLELREKIKEIIEKIKSNNLTKEEIENLNEEVNKIRERYKECLPQPMPIKEEVIGAKVRQIVQKYSQEKRNLTESFVESIKNLNEIKIDLILSGNLSGKELAEKIKEINEERKKIVKDYVEKLHELNLARKEELKEVIKQVKIEKNVKVEKEIINVSRVIVKVNNKEIEIRPGDNVTIIVEGVIVKSKVPIRYENESIKDDETNKTINVTPEKIRERIRERIREMLLERKGNLIIYNVNAEKSGRILGIFPVNFEVRYEISAEDGREISIKKPWWSFLVIG